MHTFYVYIMYGFYKSLGQAFSCSWSSFICKWSHTSFENRIICQCHQIITKSRGWKILCDAVHAAGARGGFLDRNIWKELRTFCTRDPLSCTAMGCLSQTCIQSPKQHLKRHSLFDSIYKLCLFLRIIYTIEMFPYAKVGHAVVMRKTMMSFSG